MGDLNAKLGNGKSRQYMVKYNLGRKNNEEID